MLELLHLTRDVILSVTGAFPIAEGHHLILCWLSIAVGSCEGKGGEGRWERGTQCHRAVHTGYRNLQRVPHSALRPRIVEVYIQVGTFSFCIESQVGQT